MIDINNWEWPQWLLFSLTIFNLLVSTGLHGKPQPNYCIYTVIIGAFLHFWVLVSGGFFE